MNNATYFQWNKGLYYKPANSPIVVYAGRWMYHVADICLLYLFFYFWHILYSDLHIFLKIFLTLNHLLLSLENIIYSSYFKWLYLELLKIIIKNRVEWGLYFHMGYMRCCWHMNIQIFLNSQCNVNSYFASVFKTDWFGVVLDCFVFFYFILFNFKVQKIIRSSSAARTISAENQTLFKF